MCYLSSDVSFSFILLFVFVPVFLQKESRSLGFKSLLGRNLGPQKQILLNPLRYMPSGRLRGK